MAYTNKTQPTSISPVDFINTQQNTAAIPDCLELLKLFEKITGNKAVIWGKIIGFGKYHYKQKATEADWFVTGFAPRKSEITIYTIGGYQKMSPLLEKLGKHKVSGSCLHIKKLTDVDQKILEEIIKTGVNYMQGNYEILE
ncbi:MAG: DUF1801 domain-containing protein [bacterium]